jgi:hypothetical protein
MRNFLLAAFHSANICGREAPNAGIQEVDPLDAPEAA